MPRKALYSGLDAHSLLWHANPAIRGGGSLAWNAHQGASLSRASWNPCYHKFFLIIINKVRVHLFVYPDFSF